MIFPKQLMSISELTEMGFSRYELNKYVHARGCPVIISPGGGKYKIDTEKFPEWLREYNQRPGVRKCDIIT